MKCYEVTKCSEQERTACYVWNSFRSTPADMDNIKCWVLKGVYQAENKVLFQKCQECKYYILMNKETGIASNMDSELAIISCEGVINNDRTRGLEKVWENCKINGKHNIIIDMANVTNIYSCGLGALIRIHKEAIEAGGMLVVCGAKGYVQIMFESTKLHRLLNLVPTMRDAKELFDTKRKKMEAAKATLPDTVSISVEPPKPKRNRIPCWEYFNNKNPANATTCNECFRKLSPTKTPCWIVEGVIEGVTFQYVNEDCETCPYFHEFGRTSEG